MDGLFFVDCLKRFELPYSILLSVVFVLSVVFIQLQLEARTSIGCTSGQVVGLRPRSDSGISSLYKLNKPRDALRLLGPQPILRILFIFLLLFGLQPCQKKLEQPAP